MQLEKMRQDRKANFRFWSDQARLQIACARQWQNATDRTFWASHVRNAWQCLSSRRRAKYYEGADKPRRFVITGVEVRHRFSPSGDNSSRFGACERCKQRTADGMTIYSRMNRYEDDNGPAWTYHGGTSSLFICESCKSTILDDIGQSECI